MTAPGFLKIFVADLDRAQRFYSVVFGLREEGRFSAPQYDERILVGEADDAGFALVICQRREARALSLGDAYGPIGFRAAALDSLHAAALAEGASEIMAPRTLGAYRISLVADPDGHPLELIARD